MLKRYDHQVAIVIGKFVQHDKTMVGAVGDEIFFIIVVSRFCAENTD
jgi:hypothetical protein